MATMAKVFSLVAFYNLLTLVNLVKVVSLYGIRDKIKEMEEVELKGRHFPHSSVTRHTSAHTRLPQKGVFGESCINSVQYLDNDHIIILIVLLSQSQTPTQSWSLPSPLFSPSWRSLAQRRRATGDLKSFSSLPPK